jgi:hypothetical protein
MRTHVEVDVVEVGTEDANGWGTSFGSLIGALVTSSTSIVSVELLASAPRFMVLIFVS